MSRKPMEGSFALVYIAITLSFIANLALLAVTIYVDKALTLLAAVMTTLHFTIYLSLIYIITMWRAVVYIARRVPPPFDVGEDTAENMGARQS